MKTGSDTSLITNDRAHHSTPYINNSGMQKERPSSIEKIRNYVETVMDSVEIPESDIWEVPEGMPRSIWQNKYSRVTSQIRLPDGTIRREFQSWKQRLMEVVGGNMLLDWTPFHRDAHRTVHPSQEKYGELKISDDDIKKTWEFAARGILPFAGRHLQQGDWDQHKKIMERLVNCSTALATFSQFKLGLDGSGIGSDYSSAVRRVNWDNMPYVQCVLSSSHADFFKLKGGFDSLEEALEKYPSESESVRWFKVEDSCEGWVRAIAAIETATFHEHHREKTFIFDFTPVRCEGTPIAGQQGRPASGPIPLMEAIRKITSIRGAGMQPWKQAMFIDHYLASCIALGGIRRIARIAVKHWKDRDIFEFISIKRGGGLWTANNSILVDKEFWQESKDPRTHASRVLQAATAALYMDKSGEPGFINIDMIQQPAQKEVDSVHVESLLNREYYETELHPKTYEMMEKITRYALKQPYTNICNPCSEIALASYGGYCNVSETNIYRCKTPEEFIEAVKLNAKFLIRVNRMHSLYSQETERTNRIGVSIIGIHEAAYKMFGLTFHNLISNFDYLIDTTVEKIKIDISDGIHVNSSSFWLMLDRARAAAEQAAYKYSFDNNMARPSSVTTMKPGGTVSKIMTTTECANLPAFATYLRWVQYEAEVNGQPNPEVENLKNRGYPVKDVSFKEDGSPGYPGKVVVGFPTKLPIVDLMGENVTCSTDIKIEDHFKWLMLLEKFWLGTDSEGRPKNNQISYTLKIKKEDYENYSDFAKVISEWQPKVRCCAMDFVQPIDELVSAYAYVPEEPITYEKYMQMMEDILPIDAEGYDNEQLQCSSGICPIEEDQFFNKDDEIAGQELAAST